MQPDTLPLLCDPQTHEPLRLACENRPGGTEIRALVNVRTGKSYSVRDGIPVFVSEADVTGLNLKYQRLYDRFAFLYDTALALTTRLFERTDDIELRRKYLGLYLGKDGVLTIGENSRILEVSIGTGHNILAFPAKGQYYGLDLSWGMLMRCRRNMAKYGRSIELIQGNAERLPFIDNAFDVVFHVGGINFFSDKTRAIAEMARVAKPGTRVVISDETEKAIKRVSSIPIVGKSYRGMESMAAVPVDLVPASMQDVRVDYFLGGNMYSLSFIKP